MRVWTPFVIFTSAFLYLSPSMATSSLEGNWISFNDKTGAKRAVVSLAVKDGTLNGVVWHIFPQPSDTGICSKCPGDFKNKPIQDMQIVWGLKKMSHDTWDGGRILDASTGSVYRVKMVAKDNKLYVRGYIGISMIGRTQIWERA